MRTATEVRTKDKALQFLRSNDYIKSIFFDNQQRFPCFSKEACFARLYDMKNWQGWQGKLLISVTWQGSSILLWHDFTHPASSFTVSVIIKFVKILCLHLF